MAYKIRIRKQKRIYMNDSSSSSEEEEREDYDSSSSDPEYTVTVTRTPRPRRTRRRSQQENYDSSSSDPEYTMTATSITRPPRKMRRRSQRYKPTQHAAAAAGVVEGSSRTAGAVQRRRGRPPKEMAGVRGDPLTRRPRTSSIQRARHFPSGEYEKKKTVLAWLIDLGLIEEDERVRYLDESGIFFKLKGRLRSGGVLCDCCFKEITVDEFEDHAESKLKKPYAHIYLTHREITLLTCITNAFRNRLGELKHCGLNLVLLRNDAADRHDDACMICADGGDLICCDKCTTTVHPTCMFMEHAPKGEWLCHLCICKYCGMSASGGILHLCLQCDRRYHLDCLFRVQPLLKHNCPRVFCSNSCAQVFWVIHNKFLGVRNELGSGYSWTLVRMILEKQPHSNLDVHEIAVCNSKTAVAWNVMNEIFMPSIDRFTTINIAQSVVYNRASNLKRLNCIGFYTAVLEKNDEIISVASLRVHGNKIAEVPFAGTRERFRRQGMLPKLFTAIESALCFLKVENLVIPSAPEAVPMWIEKYNLSHVGDEFIRDLVNFNTLMFPGAVRLYKCLASHGAGSGPSVEPGAAVSKEVAEARRFRTDRDQGNNSRKLALLDLNFEPAEDEDA